MKLKNFARIALLSTALAPLNVMAADAPDGAPPSSPRGAPVLPGADGASPPASPRRGSDAGQEGGAHHVQGADPVIAEDGDNNVIRFDPKTFRTALASGYVVGEEAADLAKYIAQEASKKVLDDLRSLGATEEAIQKQLDSAPVISFITFFDENVSLRDARRANGRQLQKEVDGLAEQISQRLKFESPQEALVRELKTRVRDLDGLQLAAEGQDGEMVPVELASTDGKGQELFLAFHSDATTLTYSPLVSYFRGKFSDQDFNKLKEHLYSHRIHKSYAEILRDKDQRINTHAQDLAQRNREHADLERRLREEEGKPRTDPAHQAAFEDHRKAMAVFFGRAVLKRLADLGLEEPPRDISAENAIRRLASALGSAKAALMEAQAAQSGAAPAAAQPGAGASGPVSGGGHTTSRQQPPGGGAAPVGERTLGQTSGGGTGAPVERGTEVVTEQAPPVPTGAAGGSVTLPLLTPPPSGAPGSSGHGSAEAEADRKSGHEAAAATAQREQAAATAQREQAAATAQRERAAARAQRERAAATDQREQAAATDQREQAAATDQREQAAATGSAPPVSKRGGQVVGVTRRGQQP